MLKNIKLFAFITSVAIFCSLIFSVLFIVVESNHDCDGESCHICHEIQICEQTLKTIGTALLSIVSVFVVVKFVVFCNKLVYNSTNLSTLVSLKVKLTY